MDMKQAIARVVDGHSLSEAESAAVFRQIMTGEATPAQIGGLLIGLRMKGETVDEIVGAAQVMRELSVRVQPASDVLIDTCGTGGDGAGIFNVSTAAAFVVAAAGGRVAKHGNRSFTSKSGSADLLEAAGVRLDIRPEQVACCVDQIGVGFMYAVNHHSAMKHAIGSRRELGTRTIFNLLGPLTNPAGARYQVLGVFAECWVRPMAEVLARLGSERVLVVHAEDGLDEISLASPTRVAELRKGAIAEYTIAPEDFGLPRAELRELVVHSAEESLAMVRQALTEVDSAPSRIVALNAAAAIYCAGLARSLADGLHMAQDAIAGGMALEKLDDLRGLTRAME